LAAAVLVRDMNRRYSMQSIGIWLIAEKTVLTALAAAEAAVDRTKGISAWEAKADAVLSSFASGGTSRE
jgi:hypothetical protein